MLNVNFWDAASECVAESVYICRHSCVWIRACVFATRLPWFGGGGGGGVQGWIIDWEMESGRGGGRRRGQGVPERSREFSVSSPFSIYFSSLTVRGVYLPLFCFFRLLCSSLLHVRPLCGFGVIWTIQTQLCTDPFWAISFLWSLVRMQPRFAAPLNSVAHLSRYFSPKSWTVWLRPLVFNSSKRSLETQSSFGSPEQNHCSARIASRFILMQFPNRRNGLRLYSGCTDPQSWLMVISTEKYLKPLLTFNCVLSSRRCGPATH